MPTLQDIERFKHSLNTLGKEEEILSTWGESLQGSPAPSEQGRAQAEPPKEQQEPDIPDDLAALFSSLPDGEADAGAETTEEAAADFDAFLSDLPIPDGNAVDAPPETSINDFELPDAFNDDKQALDDFSIPQGLLDGLEADGVGDGTLSDTDEFALSDSFDFPDTQPESDVLKQDADFAVEATPNFDTPQSPEQDASALERGAFAMQPENDSFDLPDFSSDGDAFSVSENGTDDFALTGALDTSEPESDTLGAQPENDFNFDAMPDGSANTDLFNIPSAQPSDSAAEEAVEVPDLSADDLAASDTFSLGNEWGNDFSIPGYEMDSAAPPQKKKLEQAFSRVAAEPNAAETKPESRRERIIDLSSDEVDALQDTLLSYPLNLRLAVEDVIANAHGSENQQNELIRLLVNRGRAPEAAKAAGRILKRYIPVPASYSKRSGAAFEADKGSFRYIFVHSILPLMRVLTLAALAMTALFFLTYNFVYRPIKANSLYSSGFEQIPSGRYTEAIDLFNKADAIWVLKKWYYRYAQAFRDEAQYPRAEAMYERLLARWPREIRAALEYAAMETDILAFEKADAVLRRYVLERDYFNRDALIMSAANALAWADMEEQAYSGPDPQKLKKIYEQARLKLATLIEHHGRSDLYLELMCLYFIRTERWTKTDKYSEIKPLSKYFIENKKSEWKAAVLAELAEYLLDKNDTEDVNAILLRAVDKDGTVPEVHIAMARWNKRSGFPDEELKAVEFANRFYAEIDAKNSLSPRRAQRFAASLIRAGELYMEKGRDMEAETAYNSAITHYEKAVQGRQYKANPQGAKAYARLGDMYYAKRKDFAGALVLYAAAERNGYTSPDVDYRAGYIHYMNDDPAAAMRYFYRAGLASDTKNSAYTTALSPYLLWASGNALYARGDFFAAQGYYAMLVKRLQFELHGIARPDPQNKPHQKNMVELLTMARNNLGASLYRIAERMGDAARRADAMMEFTESARLFDSLTRDQKSMLRSDVKNYGFLNLDFILHPTRNADIRIYVVLQREMAWPAETQEDLF